MPEVGEGLVSLASALAAEAEGRCLGKEISQSRNVHVKVKFYIVE